ncbi:MULTISPECIES: TetR/AcrR family transcriptional regulator [unclassified Streptomyces]|uniref:TetR/AcrR family transcriptional regulator n=1 Tax=unclassified Streptomyces TaxID=2593676 RepID=UPI00227093B4|nr:MULTISPECIES: TetR/AcrR family transcriptional regulator [unclassified Streptomyces]MCY0921057.1 TetR/AcrR family transcriptional regulator [Streptomyces sp. H27-G5]MCY0961109.1 TetR/AcrR family transcriptional regulator [Streptomyces sp. H27-H5]
MAQRTERADALRNREAVLAAADALFAASGSPQSVSMDDIAAAAGVGKGTLFRRFGDRAGLIGAVIASRLEPLRHAVREAQDAPGSSPRQRVSDLLDASLRFKIENRNLMTAAEDAGLSSPYRAEHYGWWHEVLRTALDQVPGVRDADFTAHALLAAIRADLVAHLIDEQGVDAEGLRSSLAAYIDKVLGTG